MITTRIARGTRVAGAAGAARSVSVALMVGLLAAGCSGDPDPAGSAPSASATSATTPSQAAPSTEGRALNGQVEVDGGRSLYLRCTGTGEPTVVLEGGDEDTSGSYAFAEGTLSEVTRTCVYDRANLGSSDPDPRRRGLPELVGDLEQILANAEVPGPYVLVGTSGGGYITAGYAFAHADQVAGMVFVEAPSPFRNPPAELVEVARWDSPVNLESRD